MRNCVLRLNGICMKPIQFFRTFSIAVTTLSLLLALAASRTLAGPVLLFEPATGEVLTAEDADQTWFPASLTKLMTVYLAFEAVKSDKLAWDSKVPLSEKARGQPATRIGLRSGIEITLEQAVRGLILRSANDFAMALAEKIGGSEEGFAEMQNATAKRLGMTRSLFKNPHGLPDPEQVTTARDMGLLAAAILKDFPDRAEVFSTTEVRIHKGTFHSQNDLLRTFEGADGMKTGFTCGAGYNVVASATRNGRKLIVVVMGALTRTTRSARATELLQVGFDHINGKKPADGKEPLKPVKLPDLAMNPAEVAPVHDMTRTTRTWKCGNRGGEPRQVAAKGTKVAKKLLAKRNPDGVAPATAAAVAAPKTTGTR